MRITTTHARRGAIAVAGGRLVLGLVAAAWPELPARPWIGPDLARQGPARVLARALGGRDLALGAGTLWSLHRGPAAATAAWVCAGALADTVDVAATLAAWPVLPRHGRSLVAAAAGGAVVVNAAFVNAVVGGAAKGRRGNG